MNTMKRLSRVFALLYLLGWFILPTPVFAHDTITTNQITAIQDSEKTFTITVGQLNAANGIAGLTCKVWSAAGSQDDVKTEAMIQNGDGSYTYTVDMEKDHSIEDVAKVKHYDKGMYYIEIYGVDNGGVTGLVDSTYLVIRSDANEWKRHSYDGSNFHVDTYRAILTVTPEIKNGTQEANSGASFKSGYGYALNLSTTVASNADVKADQWLAGAQNASTVFPEFNFKTGVTTNGSFNQFNRLSDCMGITNNSNLSNSMLELKTNPFSASSARVHFTPLWFPDNTEYTVYSEIFDAWTPGGMLGTATTNSVNINGTVYDDWQVNNKK
ncbi:GBS Bsp-like repeat-containing protein [Acetobacterium wieringae]|uniref:GBS Bsp-like repeat-containing protein n=1 Tax=Acetobacterium wieringae TaxID=52694 RepID=UPI0026EF91E5|nr:GBS Bsp-like repeat-containing protein [Acetobacterium wieringae]